MKTELHILRSTTMTPIDAEVLNLIHQDLHRLTANLHDVDTSLRSLQTATIEVVEYSCRVVAVAAGLTNGIRGLLESYAGSILDVDGCTVIGIVVVEQCHDLHLLTNPLTVERERVVTGEAVVGIPHDRLAPGGIGSTCDMLMEEDAVGSYLVLGPYVVLDKIERQSRLPDSVVLVAQQADMSLDLCAVSIEAET